MSATIFNGIAAAIVAQLQAGTPVAALIERGRPRSRPIPEQTASAVVVRLLQADVDTRAIFTAPRDWETLIAVEIYARGVGVDSGDELVDPLVHAVYSRLADDPTLGGLVQLIELQSITWGAAAEGERSGDALLTYRVLHSTQNRLLT